MEVETFCPFELEPSWQNVLKDELNKPYMAQLAAFVEKQRALGREVYPPKELVFNAFWQTPYDKVRVVIVGQDPYHGPGQAHGLSFSVPKGVQPPPSLKNIYKELSESVSFHPPGHGCLLHWAKQGVMMLNATLTVSRGEPTSHAGKGWERFTDAVIAALGRRKDPIIFVLWGRFAKDKCQNVLKDIETQQHTVLTAAHPSPFSANNGFFGCGHFAKINQILAEKNQPSIEWALDEESKIL